MVVVVPWRCVVGSLLVAITFLGLPARADVPSTQPVAGDSQVIPGFNFGDEAGYSVSPLNTEAGGDLAGPTQTISPAPEPVNVPKTINDPLPPAVWSGLSMLALCVAFLSVRRLRRQLR